MDKNSNRTRTRGPTPIPARPFRGPTGEPVDEPTETIQSEPGPEASSICDTCIHTYPSCGGDSSPGFMTEDGVITGCSQHPVPADEPPEEAPEVDPGPKPIPARLAKKRRLQKRNALLSAEDAQ